MRQLIIRTGVALAALATLGACKSLDVPNYTNASIELLQNNPTPTVINTVAVGLLRAVRGDQQIETLEIYGRDAYNLDPSEVRNVTIPLIGPLDPAQGPVSMGPYSTIRTGLALIKALDQVGAALTDAQKAGLRGFAKTWMAWTLHQFVRQTDTFGGIVDVENATPGNLAPFVSKAAVYQQIETWLDEASTDLGAAGTAFSFTLTPGFSLNGTFNTPAGFRQFNRALKVRVLEDQGDKTLTDGNGKYAAALAILNTAGATFINTTMTAANAIVPPNGGVLNAGPYHIYTSNPGDATNNLYDQTGRARLAHPSLQSDAQLKADATRDNRYLRKVQKLTVVRTLQGVSSDFRFTVYDALDAPVPVIRNEELILLRAEARLHTGDRAGALADINLIRTMSGGLTALGADPGAGGTFSGDLLLDELLYNRRYSLVYENGHRWVTLRKYDLLGQLPREQSIHVTFTQRPIPDAECSLRPAGSVAGCTTVQGLTTGPVVPYP